MGGKCLNVKSKITMNSKIIITLSVTLSMLTGCNEDYRRADMPPSMVFLTHSGEREVTLYNLNEPQDVAISVTRSGLDNVEVKAKVEVSAQALKEWNESSGTNYILLPSDYYIFTDNDVVVSADQLYNTTTLSVKVPELSKIDFTKYALPLSISQASVALNEKTKTTILTFDILSPAVRMAISGEIAITGDAKTVSYIIPLTIPFENKYGMECLLDLSAVTFDEFNDSKEGIYKQIPKEAYTISSTNVKIEAGKQTAEIAITIDREKLDDDNYALVCKLVKVTSAKAGVIINIDPRTNWFAITSKK